MTYQRDPERIVPNDDIVRRENIAQRDAEIARRNEEEGAAQVSFRSSSPCSSCSASAISRIRSCTPAP